MRRLIGAALVAAFAWVCYEFGRDAEMDRQAMLR